MLFVAVPFALLIEKPTGYSPGDISAWDLVNVPILLGLGFGVYRRSRVCSVLLTIYAVVVVIVRMMEPKPGPWAVASIFYLFVVCRGLSRYSVITR